MAERTVRRVLMTGDTVGGVWTFTLDLAEALAAHGIEVVLATLGGKPKEDQRATAAAIPNLRMYASRYRLEWMDDPWDDVEESGRWLLALAEEVRPDVVHLNSFGHGALAWRAPVVLTAHSCVLSWWDAVKRSPLPPRWNRYRYEVARSLHAADWITAPSHAMHRSLLENYGPGLPECRVIHNGRKQRREHADKEPFVLTAGRLWDEAKNVSAVARIASRLPWPAYVAGECGAELTGCRALGRLSQDALAGWYARAAIYAHPARYEPFGLCVLEAAMAGCALVLGDIESLREIWGDCAVYVAPDDSDALQAALLRLIGDPQLRMEMAARSTERARTFTPARMAQQYAEVYHAAANARRYACAS